MEEYLSIRLLTSVQTIGDLENFLCISAHSNPNYQRVEQRIIGLLCLGILTRIPNSKNIISRQAGNSRVGRLVFWLITKIRSSFCVLKVTQILQLLWHHNTNVIAGEKLWFFFIITVTQEKEVLSLQVRGDAISHMWLVTRKFAFWVPSRDSVSWATRLLSLHGTHII